MAHAVLGARIRMSLGAIIVLSVFIGIAAGLLGAGSSFFTVLLLIQLARLEPRAAIATSMAIVAGASALALVSYAHARAVLWKEGLLLAAASMIGAYGGGRLSTRVPVHALMALFLVTMVGAAIAMLRRAPPPAFAGPRMERMSPRVPTAGLLIGSLSGMVGLGGGFVLVPVLVTVLGVPVRSAVGTSLLVVMLNALAGLAGRLPHPEIHWSLAACVGVATSTGSLVGARLHGRLDPTTLRRGFAVLMIALAAALMVGLGARR